MSRASISVTSAPSPSQSLEPRALTFRPRLAERVWGGRRLQRCGKALPPGRPVGESWEISDVPGHETAVARGRHQGETLRDLVERHGKELLGSSAVEAGGRFPLLLKLIDAAEVLSVQVHPSDDDLRGSEPSLAGKTEAWIVLEAEPGARILHGLAPGTDRAALYDLVRAVGHNALSAEDEERFFRWIPVSAGDVVYVPARTIHALGGGILLLEAQQTSDITYRIYDWGRAGTDGRPRRLHVEEAARLGEPEAVPCPYARLSEVEGTGFSEVLRCTKLRLEHAVLPSGARVSGSTGEGGAPAFHILAGHAGLAVLVGPDGDVLELPRGAFALLPAVLGDYELHAPRGAASVHRIRAGA